jgi:hypothetical protein
VTPEHGSDTDHPCIKRYARHNLNHEIELKIAAIVSDMLVSA